MHNNQHLKEIKSIATTCCEHLEHSCRESCPCGYCRIMQLVWKLEKEEPK